MKQNNMFHSGSLLRHTVLTAGALLMLFPFFWMVITSLKAPEETTVFPPRLIPEVKYYVALSPDHPNLRVIIQDDADPSAVRVKVSAGPQTGNVLTVPSEQIFKKRYMWGNYSAAWKAAPFPRYFLNNLIMACGSTFLYLLTSILAAYAFSRMYFPFKKTLFMLLMMTMMVPGTLMLIPNYVILSRLHWLNTYWALIVPNAANIFGIYLISQHMDHIPQSLFDAAMLDGCHSGQILRHVVLPLSRPVILTVGLLGFTGSWNSLLYPLIVTNSPEMRTLQVGLAVFRQESGIYWEQLTAAATFSLIPLILLFLAVQKHYVRGIARSGIK